MNHTENERLKALAALILQIPAARRPGLKAEVDCLLVACGLRPAEHQYLLGERFRARVPGLGSPPALTRRDLFFYLSVGSWPEDVHAEAFASGLTSVGELATHLNRSTKMVQVYLGDARRRDRDGWTNLTVKFRRGSGLLRLKQVPPGAVAADQLTYAEAWKLAPDPTAFKAR